MVLQVFEMQSIRQYQQHLPKFVLGKLKLFHDRLQDQEPPEGESWIDFPLAYSPIPHIAAPMQNVAKLSAVKLIFFQFAVYLPRLRNSQKMPLNPYVNQEANSAEMRPSRELKLGMLSAMIHAMTQSVSVMPAHDPVASQEREPMCRVPRKMRT